MFTWHYKKNKETTSNFSFCLMSQTLRIHSFYGFKSTYGAALLMFSDTALTAGESGELYPHLAVTKPPGSLLDCCVGC